ncbi:MAG: PAS domain S-box protein [Bacteroidota bacterium]
METETLSILIIEADQEITSSLAARVGKILPFTTIKTAAEAADGIEMSRVHTPDLILVGMSQADCKGEEICTELRTNKLTGGLPILVLTSAETKPEQRRCAYEAGVDGFLNSPFDEIDLLLQIRTLTATSRILRQTEFGIEGSTAADAKRSLDLLELLKSHHDQEEILRLSNQRLEDSQRATLNLLEDIKAEADARSQTEETLRRSESNLAMAQRVANVGSWIWYPQSNRLEWSDQMYTIFGLSRDNFSGDLSEVISSAIHPDDREKVLQSNISVVKYAKPVPLEYRIIHPDGTIRTVWAEAGEIVLDEAGAPYSLAGIVQDITLRKLHETELRESRERFDLVMHATKDGLYDWNLVTNEIYYSPGWNSMLGYAEDELGSDISIWEQLIAPEYLKRSWEMLNAMFAREVDVFRMEFKMLHKDGHWVDILSRADAVFDSSGKAIRVVGTHIDISERKKSERLLRESEKRYRQLFENMTQAFAHHEIILDAEGKAVDYRFLDINPAFIRQTGLTADIIGKTIREVMPEAEDYWIEIYGGVAQSGEPIHYEQFAEVLGKHFEFWAFSPDPGQFAVLFNDITEQKLSQKLILESERSYRLLFNNMSQGFAQHEVVFDDRGNAVDFRYIDVNPAFEILTDKPASELVGRLLTEVFPGTVSIWFKHYHEVEAAGRPLHFEEYSSEIGKHLEIWGFISRPGVWTVMFTDITERKLADNALRESEERFRTIIESAQDAILMVDSNAEVTYWNPSAELIFGFSNEEVLGQYIPDLIVPPRYRHRGMAIFKHFISAGITADNRRSLQLIGLRKDGQEIDLAFSLTAVSLDGEWSGIAVIRDVTEWKRAELALRESEERVRAITQSAQDAIIMVDDAGCITYWNPAATAIFGHSSEEAIGKNPHLFLATEHHRAFSQAAFRVFSSTGEGAAIGKTLELTGVRKDGEEVDISLSLSAVKLKNRWHAVGIIRDITEWKLAEAMLRESEARFRSMLEHSPFAYQSLDDEGRFIDLNDKLCEMLGYDRGELLGKVFGDFWAPSREMEFSTAFTNLLRDNYSRGDFQLRQKDGSIIDVYLEGRVQRDVQGNFLRTHCVFFNITERAQAERNLRESEEMFRAIFQGHAAVKLLIDPKTGAISDANDAAMNFYGWSIEELKNKNIWDINTLSREEVLKAMESVLDSGRSFFEFRHRRADGTERDVEVYSSTVNVHGKNLIHSIIHDATEKKEAEKQIRLLGRSIEQSPVSIVITDTDGSIEYVNPEFTKITGFDFDEVIGLNSRILKSGSQSTEYYSNLWSTILSGQDWIGEFHNKRKDGSLYWESAVISPVISERGSITHFIGIKTDITAQKQMLADLIAAKERAEESDRLKSTFLANMSHEVRTPMNAIIGFSNLLTNEGLTKEDQAQFTEIIRQRSYDLLGIINDILNISLIDAGEMKIFEEEANIEAILKDLHLSFTQLARIEKAQSVQLLCEIELPASGSTLLLDTGRLRQVLTNLLSNALKFTHEGSISFGCKLNSEKELLFYVSDTGIGISKDAQKFIFNRFRQVDESSTRKYGGTGLGLSISKGLIELMGGVLTVESEVGVGSTFQFTLPYHPVSAKRAQGKIT